MPVLPFRIVPAVFQSYHARLDQRFEGVKASQAVYGTALVETRFTATPRAIAVTFTSWGHPDFTGWSTNGQMETVQIDHTCWMKIEGVVAGPGTESRLPEPRFVAHNEYALDVLDHVIHLNDSGPGERIQGVDTHTYGFTLHDLKHAFVSRLPNRTFTSLVGTIWVRPDDVLLLQVQISVQGRPC